MTSLVAPPTVAAEVRNGRIEVDVPYRMRDLLKVVPGARWDADARTWYVPLTWAACKALRGVFGEGLQVGPALNEWAWNEATTRVQPALALRNAWSVEPPAGHLVFDDPRLMPFQRVGVAFLETAERAILADEMGTGKTVQAVRAVERAIHRHHRGYAPVLVVCPNSVKRNWAREFTEWSGLRPAVYGGTPKQKKAALAAISDGDADALIVNWEALRTLSRLAPYGSVALKRCRECGGPEREKPITARTCEKHEKALNEIDWFAVVADEAHRAKDPKAKQTRAWWWLSHHAPVRYALTGTPIANAPDDLWAILHGIAPEEHPQRTRYIDRYCLASFNPFGGLDVVGVRPETSQEFYEVVDPRFIRRPKAAVLTELPDKLPPIVREVELAPKQKRAYRTMADWMLAELENGGGVVAPNPLTQMLRLSQFASAFAELDDEGNVRLSDPSSKLDELEAILEELGTQQVVVSAESRQLIELAAARLEKRGVSYGLITGAIHELERQSNVDRFQAGDLQAMLLTVGAGGEGITLTAASTFVHLQRSWSLVKNRQVEDRVHRIGQTDPVTVIDIVAVGTVEEYRLQRLADKEHRLQEVVRDANTIEAMLKLRP